MKKTNISKFIAVGLCICALTGCGASPNEKPDTSNPIVNSNTNVLIILGDFCPQGNFLLLRYIHRAYQFIDNLYFLYSLSVYPLRSSNVNLIYKTIQNFGRQFLYFRITSHQ